jgi:hypothetical protein
MEVLEYILVITAWVVGGLAFGIFILCCLLEWYMRSKLGKNDGIQM